MKPYISDEIATLPSSKCSVYHAHKCFTSRRMIKFCKKHGLQKNISLLQGHVHLPLPPRHCCHNPNDHHTNCLRWKHHVWQACYPQTHKNQTWHPLLHLAISSSHKNTHLQSLKNNAQILHSIETTHLVDEWHSWSQTIKFFYFTYKFKHQASIKTPWNWILSSIPFYLWHLKFLKQRGFNYFSNMISMNNK